MFVRRKQEVKNCKFCKRNGILESNVLDSNKSKISILLEELYIFIIAPLYNTIIMIISLFIEDLL